MEESQRFIGANDRGQRRQALCKVATTLKERGKQAIYAISVSLPRHTGPFYNLFTPCSEMNMVYFYLVWNIAVTWELTREWPWPIQISSGDASWALKICFKHTDKTHEDEPWSGNYGVWFHYAICAFSCYYKRGKLYNLNSPKNFTPFFFFVVYSAYGWGAPV